MTETRFQVVEFNPNQWNVVDSLSNQFISPFFMLNEHSACAICYQLNYEVIRAELNHQKLISINSVIESERAKYQEYINSDLDPRD